MAYSGSELSEMLESESELVEELPRNTTESQAPQPQFDLVDDSAINSSGLGETDTSEIHPVNLNKAAEDDVTNQQYSEVLSEISSAGESSGIGASEVQSSSPGDYQDVVEEDNDEVDSEDQSSGSTLDRSEENEVSGPAAGREALQYVTPKKEDGEGTRRKFLSKLPSMKRSLRRFSSAQDLRTSDGENLSDKIKLSRRRKSFSFFKSTESTPKSAQSSRYVAHISLLWLRFVFSKTCLGENFGLFQASSSGILSRGAFQRQTRKLKLMQRKRQIRSKEDTVPRKRLPRNDQACSGSCHSLLVQSLC